ncbi:hypothetical protein N7E81_01515 [Reichenbachiella carrageenanivorans]|uniref:Uncharacterized protein n=1 Tax=Reichenbachiella carrageenanivorans TaxID=2979869 RepID=A0ABY6D2D4_9BACT|nr:hypothetical protein [Reichenbachiella carrageenanivorans]UXX79785.1 hypothetical protein N7E81_01515 [Reichenbachiella carrageenanivorans]
MLKEYSTEQIEKFNRIKKQLDDYNKVLSEKREALIPNISEEDRMACGVYFGEKLAETTKELNILVRGK